MLVWVLVLTALLVSDVAGRNNSFEVEETQRDLEKRGIFRGPCDESWFYFSELNSCYRFFSQEKTWQEAEEGTYTWIDGSTRKYKNWAKGQPDNYGGLEHCVHIKFNGDDTWNDARCDMKIGFVCSYKLRCG
ncbi:C-type lectin lectoxin-Enh2-like isoform X2 [Pristis pectinata]|uniref:C-type lectin lectoxin-Enh2-like isoform X2 n=1 Tax=Pristis pectinata TaxID=685728 RepID=UPI00223CED4B|nr:C-type lectin lectoxin-Enh2-like isoform X2 [Pristis pectinata]